MKERKKETGKEMERKKWTLTLKKVNAQKEGIKKKLQKIHKWKVERKKKQQGKIKKQKKRKKKKWKKQNPVS